MKAKAEVGSGERAPGAEWRVAVVVTAAGSSERFGGGKKELLKIEARSILDRSVSPFLQLLNLEALVLTAPPGREGELRASLSPESLAALEALGPARFAIVAGGASRRESVLRGLERLEAILGEVAQADGTMVLVHDGARPWSSADLALRVLAAAEARGAAIPIVPLVDTPKELAPDGTLLRHPPRSSLGCAQTPQGFRFGPFLAAHRRAAAENADCTDDAELWDRYVGPVASVPGLVENRKVTFARDLPGIRELPAARDRSDDGPAAGELRVGQGWDLHRLVAGRKLMLGGVEVPGDRGEEAHSDGDVLLHASIDALLGAAALGDIGTHFPPSEAAWKDADSRVLARRAAALVREAGWEIGNLDCTIVLERPKLGPYKDAIRSSVALCLGIPPGAVSVKAKTKEGVDAVGEGAAIEASAVVLLRRGAPREGS